MAQLMIDRLGRVGAFFWSAWSGLTGLGLFCALWQGAHELYGDFIMPAPLHVFAACLTLLAEPGSWSLAVQTLGRAAQGFALATLIGITGGMIAGYSPAILRVSRSILTLFLGVPPIAWIVLAMIWFGSTNGTVVVTVAVACTPLIFATTAEGAMTRDRGLDDMARAFGAGTLFRLWTLGLRHVASTVLPVLAVSLGGAIKVAVMAELLMNIGGLGSALAMSRSNLDMVGALAWILLSVAGLVGVEYLLLRPFQAELDRWRNAARPWGVKR